ncbi:MAG: 6-phosphogluconolactonase [Elusimicrobia bacterium]|nr:MAG: 6-phosphogluconolactonase [Elusimicrobiota bacterium]
MAKADVRVFKTKAEAAEAAAGLIKEALLRAESENRPCALCLPGGATPKAVYFLLAKEAALPWKRAEFFWSDERYAPPTHPDSNFRAARDLLLAPLGIADSAVHRIATDAKDPAADARRYETALRARWPKAPTPAFDLTLLGLGVDGGTASLVPGVPAMKEEERWVASVSLLGERAPGAARHEGPPARITLTPPALRGARVTAFLALGEEKAEAVRAALSSAEPETECPARAVVPAGAPPVWLLDRDAAKHL